MSQALQDAGQRTQGTTRAAKRISRIALHDGVLDALITAVRARDVRLVLEAATTDAHRYVGLFRGEEMVIAAAADPFLTLFTIAHLFGHLCQLASGNPHQRRVATYATAGRRPTPDELNELFDYEYEAARIGRALLETVMTITPEIDAEYARFFYADSAYLENFLRSDERGPKVFERFLEQQRGEGLIKSDAPLLRDSLRGVNIDILVV